MDGKVLTEVGRVLPGVEQKAWMAYSVTVCQAVLVLAIPIEPLSFAAWHQNAGALPCCKYGLLDVFYEEPEGREEVVINE